MLGTYVVANRSGTSCTLHFTATTANIAIVGNSAVSNIAAPTEEVGGAYVSQAICGSASGPGAYWIIRRGANTVAVLDSTAQIDFAGAGMALNMWPEADLSVELVGEDPGFLMLELQKVNNKNNKYLEY